MRVNSEQKRRDWGIIIFILPLGLVMMMCVGQLAVRMSPNWSVSGEMSSSLDPENAPKQNALIVPPISSDILTPMSWWDTFLTPGSGEVEFPPFVTFEPTLTPSVTATPSETASPTVSPTGSVTTTPTPPTSTPTKKPDDNTPTPVTTCQNPAASNFGDPLPCIFPPTTCTDPTANNNGGPLPCIYPVTSTPAGVQTAVPTQVTVGTPDGSLGIIDDGEYIVLDLTLSGTPIVVTDPSDINYDMAYYERFTAGGVDMDSVIISISMDDVTYYVVFNWGDNQPNDHTNVDVNDLPPPPSGCTDLECDNQHIDGSDLHDPNGASPPSTTGILIDVDNAPSNPPSGDYWYVAIEAPSPTVNNDGADVDSIEIVDIAPTP